MVVDAIVVGAGVVAVGPKQEKDIIWVQKWYRSWISRFIAVDEVVM